VKPDEFSAFLGALPGRLGEPTFAAGVAHVQARPDMLSETIEWLIRELQGTLLLAAGEDRQHRDQMRAHYLVGGQDAVLVHVETVLSRDAPSVPTLATLSFPASRFEREMRDLLGIVPINHPDPRPLRRSATTDSHFRSRPLKAPESMRFRWGRFTPA
jgi:Ni,Fe-hydrogenase III component G